MNSIFAFDFPFPEGGSFRCKRNFADADAACEWASSMLTEGEFCYLAEVPSCTYVFEPANHPHHAVSMHTDGWSVIDSD